MQGVGLGLGLGVGIGLGLRLGMGVQGCDLALSCVGLHGEVLVVCPEFPVVGCDLECGVQVHLRH